MNLNMINYYAHLKNACDDQSKWNYVLEELRIILWNFWSSRIWKWILYKFPKINLFKILELVLNCNSNFIWNLGLHFKAKL